MTEREAGALPDTVATIGVFDGVHLGHRALLRRVVERAAEMGALSCCVTFSPHPEEVLRPDLEIRHLSPLEDRLEAIRGAGMSRVELLEFTPELSRLSPEEFIAMLLARFRLRELWVGADFALGKDRSGGHDRLAAIGRDRGFTVHSFPPVEQGGRVASSSRIRSSLAEGNVADAALLLGRPYRLRGTVKEGRRRGRTLGFPTANLDFVERLALPADGVYAAWALTHTGGRLPAAVSIGLRPTFEQEGERLVEVYLLDFQGDLYHSNLAVDFVERLRGEERFYGADSLIERMKEDVRDVRELLGLLPQGVEDR